MHTDTYGQNHTELVESVILFYRQGDLFVRIFAYLGNVYFVEFCENYRSSPKRLSNVYLTKKVLD
jgi:hypothetical protein